MITILCNWLYIGITTYLMGNAFICLIKKILKTDVEMSLFHKLFAGIMITTCYAQVFSLFGGVGMLANLIIILVCILYIVISRKSLLAELDKDLHIFKEKPFLSVCLGLLPVILFALVSSGPPKLIDTDWYHAQTIRWIEEYGCVKGVSNLFYSLGFNGAQHYFDALYSMKFIFGQSLKGAGGYFGLLLFLHGAFRLLGAKQRKHHIADALAGAEIIYIIIITAFFTDPYTDTLPNCLIFFILTEWISLTEESDDNRKVIIFPYAFLCVLAVFATVAKTSAVIIVLLVIYPAVLLIRQKAWKEIAVYILTGLLVIVPFFITNVITSGYLVYLASGADFFKVPWKIDIEVLRYSVDSMIHGARAVNASMDETLNNGLAWIPQWFRNDSASHKILYLGIMGMFLFDVVMIIRDLLTGRKQDLRLIFLRAVVYIGLVYWLMTIPQVKYCWALLLTPLAVVPAVYLKQKEKGAFKYITLLATLGALGIFALYGGFYSYRTLGYVKTAFPHYLIKQADYEQHQMVPVEKDGQTFYIREKDGSIVCGYYVFPYLNDEDMLDTLVVGQSPKDGYSLGTD